MMCIAVEDVAKNEVEVSFSLDSTFGDVRNAVNGEAGGEHIILRSWEVACVCPPPPPL